MLGGWGFWFGRFQPPWGPLVGVLGVGWVCLMAYVLSPLLVMGLPVRYLASLVHLPYYMGWKLAVGLLRAPRQWIRTPREVTAGNQSPSLKK